jgi:predicted CopG family antitoxin
MQKKLTISVEEDVYQGLYAVIGKRNISRFLSDLARPYVVRKSLDQDYAAMAADEIQEKEALDWSEAMIGDVADD